MVPIDMQPPPIILAYIDLNLQVVHFSAFHFSSRAVTYALFSLNLPRQTLAAARMLTPSVPSQNHWGDSAANNPTPATHSADAQLKVLFCILMLSSDCICYILLLFHILMS